MAKRNAIPSKELALTIVGPRNFLKVPRVQRLGLDVNNTSTDIDEHGNPNHAGTTTDTPEATLSFSAFDVGIKLFSVLTGTDWTAYPAEGVGVSSLGEVDAILYVKDAILQDYAKSASARKLQVRDFSYSYSVDGESTEDYNAIGTEKRWFKNDVIVDRFVAGTTSFTLTQTPVALKNGRKAISVILDGAYLEEVTATPATGQYAVSGTALTTGDSRTATVEVVYQAAPAGNNWTDVSDTTMPAAIKGKDVSVVIGSNGINRVQSVTINGNMRPEAVKEMGNRNIVGYQRQVPTVEGTITVLDTDTELIALLTTGNINPVDTEFSLDTALCTTSGISLEIKLVDPCDATVPYTVLKTVYVPTITVLGDSYSSNINGNAQQTFNFKSTDARCIIYSGARP
jgi:hypothetical protein